MNLFRIVAYAESAVAAVATPRVSIIAKILVPLVLILLIGIVLFICFLPSFIAYKKNHLQKTAILLLNIFLGWTFIGWVVALIWATLKDKSENANKIQ